MGGNSIIIKKRSAGILPDRKVIKGSCSANEHTGRGEGEEII